MKLWAARVPRSETEHVRRLLASSGLIHPGAVLRKDGEHILIPLAGDKSRLEALFGSDFPGSMEIIEAEFEPVSREPSLEEVLGSLPAFDVVGDIAVIDAGTEEAQKIADALIAHRKNIKVVLGMLGPVSGEFRTREVAVLAGEHRTRTVHTEYGCRYHVDLAEVYFSPRLGTERKRIADTIKPGQTVVDLFAGVGPFSILIAKTVPGSSVIAVDKNPAAVRLLKENIRLNRLDNVTAVEDDARHAAVSLAGAADHVIMNLPHSSREFLDSGILAAGIGCMVHFYDITPEHDLYGTAWDLICRAAELQGKKAVCAGKRIVRTYAPRQYNVCIEFYVSNV